MTNSHPLPAVSSVLALLLFACQPFPPDTAAHDSPLLDATLAQDLPAVAVLLAADGTPFCTGTLVAPSVILTAAHCADLGLAARARLGDGEWSVVDSALHPDYDPTTLAADLALLRLDGRSAVEPLPLAAEAPRAGDMVRLAGAGRTDPDDAASAGRLLETRVAVEAVEPESLRLGPAACSGDSGGPALSVDAAPAIFAVTSSGPPGCRGYGRSVRVDGSGRREGGDVFADWLQDATVLLDRGRHARGGCSTSGAGL